MGREYNEVKKVNIMYYWGGGQKFVEPFFVCVYSRNKKFFSCLFEGKETFM